MSIRFLREYDVSHSSVTLLDADGQVVTVGLRPWSYSADPRACPRCFGPSLLRGGLCLSCLREPEIAEPGYGAGV